jgi:multidrug resistance efflux pump
MSTGAPGRLFRREALKHATEAQVEGDVLRISPAWTRWAYWLLMAAFVVALAYSIFGTIYEYAGGPAVVWIAGSSDVTATAPGTISSIDVTPGQRVEAGARLVRFHAAAESAELARIEREFEMQLVKVLRDPADALVRQTLTSLQAQKELAAAKLEELSLRAPRAGVVGDIRIRPSQLLRAGDVVLTLLGEETDCSIMAMLPAHYRPQLQPGMSIRFEVTGYRYAYQEMRIESVSAQIIGPNEVQKFLGQEIADTVKVTGPLVLVSARPPSCTFEVDGEQFHYYHGMNGTAEARVRAESILVALVPSLRVVFEKFGG